MTTMAQAIQNYVQGADGPVTAEKIKLAVEKDYPGQWRPTTLQAHLYACVVNNPKAYIHHPSARKFLYKNSDGSFELYSEEKHGPNEWAPPPGGDEIEGAEELIEASVSFERDMEEHLVNNLESIEPGLKLIARQHSTDVGRVDLLAEDRNGRRVVIEIKVGEAKDSAVGQIARYLGWFTRQDGQAPRGVLIASDFPDGVKFAASVVPNLVLLSYKVHFTFEDARI